MAGNGAELEVQGDECGQFLSQQQFSSHPLSLVDFLFFN